MTTYAFDPTGELPANRIVERHILSPTNRGEYHFIVPRKAPFYPTSVTVRRIDGNELLVFGKDYVFGGLYPEIIKSTKDNRPVRCTIIFSDPEIRGDFEITYQTIGGDSTVSTEDLIVALKNRINNPIIVRWSEVIDRPIKYPPEYHEHHPNDLEDYGDFVGALDKLHLALSMHLNQNDTPDIQQLLVGMINQNHYIATLSAKVDKLQSIQDGTIGALLDETAKELEEVIKRGNDITNNIELLIDQRLTEVLTRMGEDSFLKLSGGTVNGILGWLPVQTTTQPTNRYYYQRLVGSLS